MLCALSSKGVGAPALDRSVWRSPPSRAASAHSVHSPAESATPVSASPTSLLTRSNSFSWSVCSVSPVSCAVRSSVAKSSPTFGSNANTQDPTACCSALNSLLSPKSGLPAAAVAAAAPVALAETEASLTARARSGPCVSAIRTPIAASCRFAPVIDCGSSPVGSIATRELFRTYEYLFQLCGSMVFALRARGSTPVVISKCFPENGWKVEEQFAVSGRSGSRAGSALD